MNNNVLLIFPPLFEPFQPYLSLPYLKGILNHYHIRSSLYDANLDFYLWTFKEKKLENSDNTNSFLNNNINEALSGIYQYKGNYQHYNWSINIIEQFLNKIPCGKLKLSLYKLDSDVKYFSEGISEIVEEDNIFNEFYKYQIRRKIEEFAGDCILFSVPTVDQIIPTLVFSKLIKEERKEIKIYLGGPFISHLYNELNADNTIQKYIDGIFKGDGFKSFNKIFNLEIKREQHFRPDFRDLELKKYLSPQLVIPYLITHGCRWGKCLFCSHHNSYDDYWCSNLNEVIDDLESIRKETGTNLFSFSDEYIPFNIMNSLCDEIKRKNLNIFWSTFAKAEKEFKIESNLRHISDSGCKLLFFGFESLSKKVLLKVKKGNDPSIYDEILINCFKNDIAVRVDFMLGLPFESEEDIILTKNFILDNVELLSTPFTSIAVAVFEMRKGTPIYNNFKQDGLINCDGVLGCFDEQVDYKNINNEMSFELVRKYRNEILVKVKKIYNYEFRVPFNKTHQLILKKLYDLGLSDSLKNLEYDIKEKKEISWNRGILQTRNKNKITLLNIPTNSEIELDSKIEYLVQKITNNSEKKMILEYCKDEKIKLLLDYLYENEFIKLK